MEDECEKELGRPISTLKVTELRDELTRRALTKTGNKKELIDRLRLAIQRESSQASAAIDTCQIQGQQQQLQNVSQYLNAAVAMQQNPVVAAAAAAAAYQIQPQANAFTLPNINQQQFQPAMMQPLDLQQMAQIKFASAEYQQQQQQQQSLAGQQQYQTSVSPAIDMRVSLQSSQPLERSMDLSTSSKQSVQPEMMSEPTNKLDSTQGSAVTTDDQQGQIENKDETSSMIEEPAKLKHNMPSHDTTEQPIANSDDCSKLDSTSDVQSQNSTEANDSLIKETSSEKLQEVKDASQICTTLPDTCSAQSELKAPQSEVSQSSGSSFKKDEPTTISLKRGGSDQSGASGSKEKRRKWSSKANADGGQSSELTPSSIMTGGISSQKLQELIVEKSESVRPVTGSKVIEADSFQGSKEGTHDMEEGEVNDTSGELPEESISDQPLSKEQPSTVETRIEEEAVQEISEPQAEPTNVIIVQNLVRPFTLMQLKEVLTKHGPIIEDKFWTDKVKSKCCAMYETVEIAQSTKDSLNGQQWPASNPKTLKVSYITEEILTQYQKTDLGTVADGNAAENGGTDKSIANRLGDRLDDGDGPAASRLGARISADVNTKSSSVNRDGVSSKPQEFDDLFKKTKSIPHLFWLPLTDSQAEVRQKERADRVSQAAEKSRRSPPRRRSPIRHRSPRRSPPSRQRSPVARRSSPRHRSPPRRSSPRHRSPLLRRSPLRRRSPMRNSPPRRRSPGPLRRSPNLGHRSPGPARRSPGPIRRSPGPIRRSPGPMRRSPGQTRRSPGPARRSPGPIRRSPGPIRRSPGPNRRSPGPIRRSPGPIRRLPGPIRRSPGTGPARLSPGLIRRSPAPIRGTSPGLFSPQRRRSPMHRRSPPRQLSPGRGVGLNSDQRRLQRPYSNK